MAAPSMERFTPSRISKLLITLAHGPRSCAYISYIGAASAVRRMNNRHGPLGRTPFAPALLSSEMDERFAIFGGNDSLETPSGTRSGWSPRRFSS